MKWFFIHPFAYLLHPFYMGLVGIHATVLLLSGGLILWN
jgi:hypothetical protein